MTCLICAYDVKDERSKINHVLKLIELGVWDEVYLVSYSGHGNPVRNCKILTFDQKTHLSSLTEEIKIDLKSKIKDFEVAINLVSGDGKLHMALLTALLKLGVGLRFVAMTVDGIKEV